MAVLHITGGATLSGSVAISGRKNAALKLVAATLLTTGTVTLRNVPNIADVRVMLTILEEMGAVVQRDWPTVTICTKSVTSSIIPHDLGRSLRASLVLVGPLVARFGSAIFPHPGGCVIGKRTIAPHLAALESLGASITFDGTTYTVTSTKLTGSLVYLKEKSVTGTENLIMAACGASGVTTIWNAAEEQHISNLGMLLGLLGYSLSGVGTSRITVTGGDLSNKDAEIEVIYDEIEAGTFAVAALVTQSTLSLTNVGTEEEMLPITMKLRDFGANLTHEGTTLTVHPSHLVASQVQTNPWPGFPPDLQSPMTVLATQAEGMSTIHDWMYEGRLAFTDLLVKMGANIVLCDPHRALVTGPTRLRRSALVSPDLRAGAAYVLAALVAQGTTTVERVELIDRGYDRLDERLTAVGAQITRHE